MHRITCRIPATVHPTQYVTYLFSSKHIQTYPQVYKYDRLRLKENNARIQFNIAQS